ncbi:MAG TPA: acylphosphatase [Coriobacteriia bacterium]|nr:acylphosphatase [Coriobacteriia bacterium]
MGELIRRHVRVSGTVQGVSFRAETLRMAKRTGVHGWVRNLPDGRVEAVFEGAREAVDAAVAWCGNGPVAAVVEELAVADEPPEGVRGFEIRWP